MAVICNNISVNFAGVKVLHTVNFTASPGKITAIIGPNGSGKSTLLKTISGDLRFSGSITLNSKDISNLSSHSLAEMRAVLPQSSSLAFPFRVIEVVRLGLTNSISKENKESKKNIPFAALEKVRLHGLADRLYQTLSGGEKQRVQLARVLAQVWVPVYNGQPRWLLLDEPISSLEIAHQLLIMNLTRDFVNAGGGAIVVMHDLNLSAMFADWIYLMNSGQTLVSGVPEKVISDTHLSEAYNCIIRTKKEPINSEPWLIPHTAALKNFE